MRYLKLILPDCTMEVSKIVLGTDYFGTDVNKETAFELLDKFVTTGGNCIDTARIYAEWLPGGKGASERLIGEWVKSRNIRNKIILSTKGGHPPLENMQSGRLSRECIEKDLEESLKALDVETIDIYLLHRDEVERPVAEIMESLHRLVIVGKVRAIGCSNWKVHRIKEANEYALTNKLTTFSVSQIQWSLAESTPDKHLDPTIVCMNNQEYQGYLKQNMSVMAYSSQAKGFFTRGVLMGLESINQKAYSRFYTTENITRLERVKEYANENKLTPTAVALGYITCNKLPGMAVVGCKSIEQLEDTLTASDLELAEETVDWLFKI